MFGRGGEEALYLKEHGVAFEVIHEITAAGVSFGIPSKRSRLAISSILLSPIKNTQVSPPFT